MTCPRPVLTGLLVLMTVALGSCSPKKFGVDASNKAGQQDDPPGGGGGGIIDCSPLLNGSSTSLTISATGSNPSLSANCTPSAVTHSWSVTRNNAPITVAGLTGATSVPDFVGAGPGTYLITLDATAVDWTDFHLDDPLQVTVQNGDPTATDIVCNPRLNGSATSVTLTTANPTVAANCTPAGVSYVWTAQRSGVGVTVPGLAGSSSTPDFLSLTAGTYQIWLSASLTDYNPYTQPSPLTVVVPDDGTNTPVHETHTIPAGNNKLDLLLVVDDSSSMLEDNQHLASRLQGFVDDLTSKGFDWQMCVTLTRAQRISSSDPDSYWGASVKWTGNPNSPSWILKKGTAKINKIFANTIDDIGAGWSGTNDERAIKAARWHLWNGEPGLEGTSGCYRADAGLAVLILSDEDERSVGGDKTQIYYDHEKNKPLESDDKPANYVKYVKQVFGNTKRFTVNSIIVRPGNASCMAKQDKQGTKSHFGVLYNELSELTGGSVGSICATDYSADLEDFADNIGQSQASVPLQCTPIGTVTRSVSPNYSHTAAIDGNRLVFTPAIPAGSTVTLDYTCP